jgi:phosphoribosylformylglycinamidine synthase
MKDNSIISIQDMGAAGLTSSSVEMASKGDLGIELELDKVPCREVNMSPYEMMLSESQERMLIILEDGKEETAKKIFDKWDLDFVVIGKTTNTNNLTLKFNKKVEGEIPIEALASKAPIYDRKWKRKKHIKNKVDLKNLKKIKIEEALIKILSNPNHSNKNWVTDQYDQMVMCDTVQKSGSDAAIIRIHNKEKAIAVSVDSSANYCKSFPFTGGKQIVCENWRNLITVGAKPVAITNCLNFGNPENQEIMGQFAECLEGIKEACEFLDYPVVSGNVSFYNGTNKKNISPTPVIGGVGLIKKLSKTIDHRLKKNNSALIVIGKTFGHLEQSSYLKEIYSISEGMPPEINLVNEKNNGECLLKLIDKNLILSSHDVSSGGLIVALAEMSINSNFGLKIRKPAKLTNLVNYFFGEDQARYIIEIEQKNLIEVEKNLKENNVFYENIGFTQSNFFEIEDELKINIKDLFKINNEWYNNY